MRKSARRTGHRARLAVAVSLAAAVAYAAYRALLAVGPYVALAAWLAGTGAALSVAYVIRETCRARRAPLYARRARALPPASPARHARASLSEPLTGYVLSRAGASPRARSAALTAGQARPGREPVTRERAAIRRLIR